MICQMCNSAVATLCVSQIIGGQKVDVYICKNCANESAAKALRAALGISDMMPSKLAFGVDQGKVARMILESRCQSCGKTFGEIRQDGKVGCARCYESFRERLRPTIERIHRSATHRGRRPSGVASVAVSKEARVDELRAALERAVRAEEYEAAARLRDQIREEA